MKNLVIDESRLNDFRKKVVPGIAEYVKDNPSTLLAILTAGRLFGSAAYNDLLKMGLVVDYLESDKKDVAKILRRNRPVVYGRTIIPVDDDIYTRDTFRQVNSQIEQVRTELDLRGPLWAVEFDSPGIAQWSCNKNNKQRDAAASKAVSAIAISAALVAATNNPAGALAGPALVYGPKLGEVVVESGKRLAKGIRALVL